MTDLSKNTKSRFGSDWDLDLGWVLIWFIVFLFLGSIFASLSYASVQNNRGNVARDNYYADKCGVVSRTTGSNNNGTTTYQCQGK